MKVSDLKLKPDLANILKDPYFTVEINYLTSSPNPEMGIWHAQHQTVCEDYVSPNSFTPAASKAGEAIIKHQLNHEHWSVLNFGFIHFHFGYFPHSTMTQLTRHRDTAFLVQSGRYTGNRFAQLDDQIKKAGAINISEVEKLFFFRQPGVYTDRTGTRIDYTEELRKTDIRWAVLGCELYNEKIKAGFPFEMARDVSIPYCFRQHMQGAGTFESWFHWLDQRTKANAELEIQALAYMSLQAAENYCPTLVSFYLDTRFGKARLAP